MNFATWSIRNPAPAILLFALLTWAGISGFRALPIASMPDIELPIVTISLSQPGAAPPQLETEVARKVENSLSTISGVKHIYSNITDGQVTTTIEFVLEKSLSDALIETKDAVDRVRADLPSDLREPSVSATRIAGESVVRYAVASPTMNEEALSWFVDDTISKVVQRVPGVGKLERIGGVQRQVQVLVDPARMTALGVTANDVSRALRSVQQESSGGRTELGSAQQAVRVIATVQRADELRELPLVLSDGRRVRLDEVATVSDSVAQRTQLAQLDGRPAIGFDVFRAKGADEDLVAQGVAATLAKLSYAHPGLAFTAIAGSVQDTRRTYSESMRMLYEGALLAVIVVWIFLRNWRATLISASALPLSILPAFAVMHWVGYTLNGLTLLSMSVIIGILVDDAIVEIENIERHRLMGKSTIQAAGEAVSEIALAVVATTMTLVVVFLPTSLMDGIAGRFFQQFGWTAVVAVLSSLLVARILTPMLAAYCLGETRPHAPAGDSWIMRHYLRWVAWCLQHRVKTLIAALLVFAVSIALVPMLKMSFIPAGDFGYSNVNIELPPGTALQTATGVANQARERVRGLKGVEHVFTRVGDGSGNGEIRKATLTLVFAPVGSRPTATDINNMAREALRDVPGARFSMGVGGNGEKLQLVLASDDINALREAAAEAIGEMRQVPGLRNVSSTASLEREELVVRPDRQRAAELGVSTAEIGETVRVATNGDFDSQLAKLNLDSRQVDILVSVPPEVRRDLDAIRSLRVHASQGLVPLSSVAELSFESGPSQINRQDRRRYVTLNADLGGQPLGPALDAVKALPALQHLPASVQIVEAGDAELMVELLGGFGIAIAIGLMCVYCVLVLLFHDFFQPFTILSAVPLSLGGAFVAMLTTSGTLSLPSMIGLVMLMGIVTKNSILLVEYAVMAIRERGLPVHEALIDACHKRARPIVMTTVAMIAGMAPIGLGLGGDSSFRQPMAVAVIGGLITSTALSLLFVPVVFTYVDGIARGIGRWLKLNRHDLGRLGKQ